tara:strand:+ start:101172 stop:101621 length:450 start_codon:yes stop_codon:yes gene_type:complete
MTEVLFLASGNNINDALFKSCELVGKLFPSNHEVNCTKKIDINCESLKAAEELDVLLWKFPKFLIIAHGLINKIEDNESISIGYPGTKFIEEPNKILINFLPGVPKRLSNYDTCYQIVIEDSGKYREQAARSWLEYKKSGMKPRFIKEI